MVARHEKRYANGPKLEKGEDGKPKVTRGEKKTEQVSDGTDGIEGSDKAAQDMNHRHAKERMELFHKHEKEHLALSHKEMKAGHAPAGEPETKKKD